MYNWNPWLTSLLMCSAGPLIILLVLIFGPCLVWWTADQFCTGLDQMQLLVLAELSNITYWTKNIELKGLTFSHQKCLWGSEVRSINNTILVQMPFSSQAPHCLPLRISVSLRHATLSRPCPRMTSFQKPPFLSKAAPRSHPHHLNSGQIRQWSAYMQTWKLDPI